MSRSDTPANVGSMAGLGPDALAYARARVSLLGAGDHCATIETALNALDGLPVAALIGGWSFKGFTAWAQGLEEEIDMLKANLDSSPSLGEWNALRADAERYAYAKTLEGQVVTMETLKNLGAAALDNALDEAMAEDADARNQDGYGA